MAKASIVIDAINITLTDTKSESLLTQKASLMTLGHLISFWEGDLKLKEEIQNLLKHMAEQSEKSVSQQALNVIGLAARSQPELIPYIV